MKITENLIVALLKHGVYGDMKNFKTSISIPAENKNDPPTTVIVTAEALQIRIVKEDK